MMPKESFIPELHDIGKLVDKDRIRPKIEGLGIKISDHTFENLTDEDFKKLNIEKPNSPSWWGQYHHVNIDKIDLNDWNFIPNEYKKCLFLLKIADHLASSVSRVGVEGIFAPKTEDLCKLNLIKLWNKKFYEKNEKLGRYWAAFKSIEDLKELFNEIQNCTSGEEFLEKYKEHLLLTPENKSFPWNLTTLYTHCKLVGKIYRVLEKHVSEVKENGRLVLEYLNKKVTKIKDAEGGNRTRKTNNPEDYKQGEWKFKLVKCKIQIPHYFVRLYYLNILRKREELIKAFIEKHSDYVLLYTHDFLLLFLPLNFDLNKMKELFQDFLDWNFIIECVEIGADLGILRTNLDEKKIRAKRSNDKSTLEVLDEPLNRAKVRLYYLQPKLSDNLDLPICDICQLNKGVERWKENIREWVCDKCQNIRELGEPFPQYAEWDKEETRVIWFKVSLDIEKLEQWLKKAFKEYLYEEIKKRIEDLERRISNLQNEMSKKQSERTRLIFYVKTLKDKNKKRKIGGSIKALSEEIKKLEEELEKLENKKNTLHEDLTDLNNKVNILLEEFRSLALIVDFVEDYKQMLKRYYEKLKEQGLLDLDRLPIRDYYELNVVKFDKEKLIQIVNTFVEIFDEIFPDVEKNEDSPVKISLFVGTTKYPLRDIWRFFEEGKENFINVRVQGVGYASYSYNEFREILKHERITGIFFDAIKILEKTGSNILHKLHLSKELSNRDLKIIAKIGHQKMYILTRLIKNE